MFFAAFRRLMPQEFLFKNPSLFLFQVAGVRGGTFLSPTLFETFATFIAPRSRKFRPTSSASKYGVAR